MCSRLPIVVVQWAISCCCSLSYLEERKIHIYKTWTFQFVKRSVTSYRMLICITKWHSARQFCHPDMYIYTWVFRSAMISSGQQQQLTKLRLPDRVTVHMQRNKKRRDSALGTRWNAFGSSGGTDSLTSHWLDTVSYTSGLIYTGGHRKECVVVPFRWDTYCYPSYYIGPRL
jgi:hypothetical protein